MTICEQDAEEISTQQNEEILDALDSINSKLTWIIILFVVPMIFGGLMLPFLLIAGLFR